LLPETAIPFRLHCGQILPGYLDARDLPWLRMLVEEVDRFRASLTGPASPATDGINVYWTERDADLPNYTGVLRKCPVSGCGDGPITVASGYGGPSTVAVDGDDVYWTDSGGNNQGGYGRIGRAPKSWLRPRPHGVRAKQ
jgi:hypothetical protein